jgi:uncharacterized protein (TIGR03663 family)
MVDRPPASFCFYSPYKSQKGQRAQSRKEELLSVSFVPFVTCVVNLLAQHMDESKSEKIISIILFTFAVALAAWLRFHQLDIKPLHHDEGVNSHFLLNLVNYGSYKYDPTNYHGPTLYYFAAMAFVLFGASEFALRFWPALFGLLTVLMIWPLRRHLGAVGTPVAAFCLALSPGLVYFSRDFIHEMSFGCFSLGIVVCSWRYVETRKFVWLLLSAISAGLLFATKETAIITAGVLLIAIGSAAALDNLLKQIRERNVSTSALLHDLKRDSKTILPSLDHSMAALVLFLFINLFFYTSLFTHWQGAPDAVKSIWLWSQRSGTEHVKSFWYYLGILLKLELPILIGALLAAVFVLRRGTRFWLFVAAWVLGIVLAYSIIGYKTPWLMISCLIPMGMISGYAAQQLYQLLPSNPIKILWLVVIALVLIYCWRLTWAVNFVKYDDNGNSAGYFTKLGERLKLKPYLDGQYGYVYAQTDRDIFNLVEELKNETIQRPLQNRTGIYVASPDYWPLPWYLRDYYQVAYTGNLHFQPGQSPKIIQPVVIANANQKSQLDSLPGWMTIGRAYTLRPGVDLVIYIHDEEENTKQTEERSRNKQK